jgi:four helix bundle protein
MVHEATEAFPAKERFGLTSQLRRAAVSISANIAEGSSRASNKDFSRFVEIAFGSLCETVSHLHISKSQRLLSDDKFTQLYAASEELSKMLSSFRNSLGKWMPE